MNYQVIEKDDKRYVQLLSTANPLRTEKDALELISLCWEHETHSLLIPYTALAKEFFILKTRVAGDIIQKFINYGIKVAAVIPHENVAQGRFGEMARETNKGSHFRIYSSKTEAENWLVE